MRRGGCRNRSSVGRWVRGFGPGREVLGGRPRLCAGERTLQLRGAQGTGAEYGALAQHPLSESRKGLPGREPSELRRPRGCAHRNAARRRVRSPSAPLASPPSRQTTSRKRGLESPRPRGERAAGPRVLGLRSRGPSLTHLMLFHHFAEAGIPLRDPSVELGDSHVDCQH